MRTPIKLALALVAGAALLATNAVTAQEPGHNEPRSRMMRQGDMMGMMKRMSQMMEACEKTMQARTE